MTTCTIPDIRISDEVSWESMNGDERGRVTGFTVETNQTTGKPVLYMRISTEWKPDLQLAMNVEYLELLGMKVVSRVY